MQAVPHVLMQGIIALGLRLALRGEGLRHSSVIVLLMKQLPVLLQIIILRNLIVVTLPVTLQTQFVHVRSSLGLALGLLLVGFTRLVRHLMPAEFVEIYLSATAIRVISMLVV